jgi:hypothetical protein
VAHEHEREEEQEEEEQHCTLHGQHTPGGGGKGGPWQLLAGLGAELATAVRVHCDRAAVQDQAAAGYWDYIGGGPFADEVHCYVKVRAARGAAAPHTSCGCCVCRRLRHVKVGAAWCRCTPRASRAARPHTRAGPRAAVKPAGVAHLPAQLQGAVPARHAGVRVCVVCVCVAGGGGGQGGACI